MEKIRENKGGVIVLLALLVITVAYFVFKGPKAEAPTEEILNGEPLVGPESSANVYLPMPEDAMWIPNEVTPDKLTLNIPSEYFVSKPRIGDCDVTSISAENEGKPISIALVYNSDCNNADLKINAAKSVEKNGYTFRTNYTSPSVIAVFEKLVESAK